MPETSFSSIASSTPPRGIMPSAPPMRAAPARSTTTVAAMPRASVT
jgi:hypothetical protein